MKIFMGFVAALLALNGVLASPARSPNDDAEVISVPRRPASSDESSDVDFNDFKGVIDTGSGYPFLQPHPPPFSFNLGFFDTFEDLFRRLRTNLWPISGESGEGGLGGLGGLGGIGGLDVDGKKANSTSTVKVVDGHKIEVNETVYGDDDSTFRVRIVNIRPLESGESVEETVRTSEGEKKPETVTSSPKDKNRENSADSDDSDERREPLERDNEIRGNADEASKSNNNIKITLLPTTTEITKEEEETEAGVEATATKITSSEDNSNGNLNATFVSDNSTEEPENGYGNGNIEAETNKPSENDEQRKMLKNYDETTASTFDADADSEAEVEQNEEEQTNASTDSIAAAADDVISSVDAATQEASLTIENNEETETNDNFNESSEDDATVAVTVTAVESTKNLNKLTLNEQLNAEQTSSVEDEEAVAQNENTSSTFELNSEAIVPVTSAIETFDVVDGIHAADVVDAVDVVSAVSTGEENVEPALLSHENYKREREHYYSSSSSDDEDAEAVEMNPTFNSEWEHLAEDLAQTNDRNNDLSNDIDDYASVPVDLSNDIAVNDIAAAQPDFQPNPDAEFINVDEERLKKIASMPMFEKLSVSTDYQPATLETGHWPPAK